MTGDEERRMLIGQIVRLLEQSTAEQLRILYIAALHLV